MASEERRKGSWMDTFIAPAPEKDSASAESATPAPAPTSRRAAPAPTPRPVASTEAEVISLLGGGPALTPAAAKKAVAVAAPNSGRISDLINNIKARVPVDNAVIRLASIDESLRAAIPDAEQRHAAALGVLKSTPPGCSDAAYEADRKEVAGIIRTYLDELAAGLTKVVQEEVEGRRQQAATKRQDAATLEAQIRDLNGEADDLEDAATKRESDVTALHNDIEAARAAANSMFGV